jgi:hypothetical protein
MFSQIKKVFTETSVFDFFPRYCRLKGSLETYKAELDFRIKNNGQEDAVWAKKAKELLDEADRFLNLYKIDEAWKCFHTAQRQEIFGTSAQERIELSKILISESGKLNNWRMMAIIEMLGNPDDKHFSIPAASTLAQATKIKDEHYNNIYYQNRLTRSLYKMLFFMLAIVIALLFWFSNCFIIGSCKLPNHDVMILGVILFGLLGAITSSILFTRNQAETSSITEIATNTFVVLSKIAVGVGFTIFIYFLLRSSFLDAINLFTFKLTTDVDYYTIAFLSGFTERLAQNAMSLIIGKGEGKTKAKS